jgi:hypothetical protein
VRRCLKILLAALGGVLMLLGAGAQVALAEPAFDIEMPEVELAPGNRLVCDPGSWGGSPSEFIYTWLRDGSAFQSSAKGVYELKSSDKGHVFTCIVKGTNGQGGEEEESWNAYEDGTGVGKKPIPTSPPAEVSGTAEVGKSLECKKGGFEGVPTPTYTYEWLREGVPIESATGTTYTVREADSGYSLSCRVTATNTLGSAQKQSSGVKISGSPPSDKTLPKVEGNVAVGQQLTCKPEEWKGAPPPTFTYQWFRSGNSEAIATGSTYTIETADQLHTLSCKVTATNSYGKAEAKSSNSVEVPGSAPVGELPTVAGAGEVGSKLTCQPGKWSGVPTPSFQYQWLLGSEPISGAKTASYTVASEDAGRTVACQVTAENTYGKAVEVSKPLPIEGKAAPVETRPEPLAFPEISGVPAAGNTLTCSEGTWHAEPAVQSYSYHWYREGTQVGSESKFTVGAEDRGLKLLCRVTAKNRVGSASADSEPVAIRGTKPEVRPGQLPTIGGALVVGETLSCAPGSWEGAPKPTFSYRWLRNGVVAAAGNSYVVQRTDRGDRLACEVTATNIEGGASATSAEVAIPAIPPKFIGVASISGPSPPVLGSTLTCNSKWEGEPEPTITYVWLTDGGPIGGANAKTHEVTKFDEGRHIACEVVATNPGGQERVVSSRVSIPGSPPEVAEVEGKADLPTVEGLPEVGERLSCNPGLWRGKPSPTLTYQWLVNGSEIAGATGETYIPEQEQLGAFVSCEVIATNEEGSQEAWSENDPQIVPRTVRTLVVSSATPFTKEPTPKHPTAAQILASLERQLSAALKKARRSGMLKHGSYSFSFESPTGGKLEVLCYQPTKAKASSKVKPVLLARVRNAFRSVSKGTQKLALTLAGRHYLDVNKHAKMTVKVNFVVTGGSTVAWSKSIVLSG